MKNNGSEVVHPVTCMVVGYLSCPRSVAPVFNGERDWGVAIIRVGGTAGDTPVAGVHIIIGTNRLVTRLSEISIRQKTGFVFERWKNETICCHSHQSSPSRRRDERRPVFPKHPNGGFHLSDEGIDTGACPLK